MAGARRKEAVANGWLVSAEVFTGDGISQELMSRAEEKIGNKDILPELAQSLERVAGYAVGVHISNTGSLTQPERQMAAAGLDAAPFLKRLITNPEVSTVAVAYGSTLRCLLDGLRNISPIPIRPDSPITCVPMRGDAGLDLPDSPTPLSRLLSEIVNGPNPNGRYWRAPTAIPPVRPSLDRFGLGPRVAGEVLESYYRLFTDFADCFSPAGIGARPNLVISAVGPPLPVSSITRWIFELAGFDASSLPLAGDLAGLPILDNREVIGKHVKAVAKYERERIIGLRSVSLRRIVRDGGRVLAVAFRDLSRCRCLWEAVRQALVSDVIVDRPIAKELIRLSREAEA